jgi:hypothetical protein
MHQFDWNDRKRTERETASVDPIALTLALWLGLVVGVTGLMRLSENAAANAVRMQQDQQRPAGIMVRQGAMMMAPYGG